MHNIKRESRQNIHINDLEGQTKYAMRTADTTPNQF
jgi:hypothetical protein